MNQETLNKFLNEMSTMLQQTKDFAVEQIPLVMQEVLKYNLAMSVMNTFAVILALVVLFIVSVKLNKYARSAPLTAYGIISDSAFAAHGAVVFNIIMMIYFGAVLKENIDTVIKIKLAPRVYLIEYASKLIR